MTKHTDQELSGKHICCIRVSHCVVNLCLSILISTSLCLTGLVFLRSYFCCCFGFLFIFLFLFCMFFYCFVFTTKVNFCWKSLIISDMLIIFSPFFKKFSFFFFFCFCFVPFIVLFYNKSFCWKTFQILDMLAYNCQAIL